MFKNKYIQELRSILNSLKSELTDLDKNSVSNKERKYSLASPKELNLILRSTIPTKDKKSVILSQVGLVRINRYSECYES